MTVMMVRPSPLNSLRWWRDRLFEWQSMGKDVYVHFNNNGYGYVVYNAKTLKWLLSEV